MDFAINASPDHPWAKEHRDWFYIRPDGTIKFAENPPKRYEDVYPLNFSNPDWEGLWQELRRVILFVDRSGRHDLPGRQSAHQTNRVLGMADRGCAGNTS